MAEVVLKTTFKFRRGDSAEWDRINPILAEAEPGFELDTGMLKIGNGVTPWRNLLYIGGGDISLSGDGKSIIIDGNIISLWGFEEAQTGQSIRKTAEGTLEWYTPTGGGLGLEPKKIDNLDEIDLTDPDASKFLYLLLRPVPNNNDIYDGYIIIDGAIEHIGSTGVDLSEYATNEKVDSIPNTLLSTISPLVVEDGILLRLTDSTRVRDKWGALAPRSVEIPLATSELAGLISGEEKVKLEEIAEGAQVNPEIIDSLETGGIDKVLSAEQGKVLKELIDELAESGVGSEPLDPAVLNHLGNKITSEEGVHGIRYYDGSLQIYIDSMWNTIETGGSSNQGVPPADVSDISIDAQDGQLTICWTDPEDTYFEEIPMAIWAGTKLVRKLGSYPTSPTDGTLVVNNTERNAFATTGYVDTGLINGTTYYYGLFPYSNTNQVNTNETNRISGKPQQFVVFGVSIDLTNSNPETAVTYTDDAVGMTPGSSAWDSAAIFKDIKPCLFKNGVVQYYLDRSDFTKKADGTVADITSGDDGDVMIEIPKIGFKINTVGDTLTAQVTNNPAAGAAGFRYYAHTRTTEGDRDFIYIGAYMGHAASSTLYSGSGKAPSRDVAINNFRTYARAKGTGYNILTFFEVTLLQCLFLIKYKNRDSQTALGRGLVASGASISVSGVTNTLGFNYGEATGTIPMKFLGIENLWGNLEQFMDGVLVSNDGSLLVAFNTSLYSDADTNYTNTGHTIAPDTQGFLVQTQGTTETGFICKTIGGSSSTHFADYIALLYGGVFRFGGAISNDHSGIFYHKTQPGINAGEYIGSRLTYI